MTTPRLLKAALYFALSMSITVSLPDTSNALQNATVSVTSSASSVRESTLLLHLKVVSLRLVSLRLPLLLTLSLYSTCIHSKQAFAAIV